MLKPPATTLFVAPIAPVEVSVAPVMPCVELIPLFAVSTAPVTVSPLLAVIRPVDVSPPTPIAALLELILIPPVDN